MSTPVAAHVSDDADTSIHPVQAFFRDYSWIHTGVGIIGNALFFVGSVFFLWESTKLVGIWMFIVGAGFMLFGSVGDGIVKLTERRS